MVQKAVSNKNGQEKLYIGKKSNALNRIYNSRHGQSSISIESVRLDDFIEGRIDLMKIDINGGEGLAFQGMRSVLRRTSKIILEFYPVFAREGGSEPMHILNTLEQSGFKLQQIKGENLEPLADFQSSRASAKTSAVEDFRRFLEELKDGSTLFCEK